MILTPTKLELGGVSRVNTVTPCASCGKFTRYGDPPLVDVRLWLTTPRGATTYGCRLPLCTSCLQKFVTYGETLGKEKLP